jgi:hypothetical protein
MAAATLDEVQRLVDQLSPLDQARLLEYLAPRIARVMASAQPAEPTRREGAQPKDIHSEAWQRLVRIGESIAASAAPDAESMTSAVVKMRR